MNRAISPRRAADRRPLDDIDRAIVHELERDGRLPNRELAARVGVAESTSHQRLRSLIESGVIRGFHADADPAALGLHLEALISIRLHANARGDLRRFHARLERMEPIRHVYFLAGDRDFLVHVVVADANALRDFVSDELSPHEEVAATSTSLIFDQSSRHHGGR